METVKTLEWLKEIKKKTSSSFLFVFDINLLKPYFQTYVDYDNA